jgi:hypothetical protein
MLAPPRGMKLPIARLLAWFFALVTLAAPSGAAAQPEELDQPELDDGEAPEGDAEEAKEAPQPLPPDARESIPPDVSDDSAKTDLPVDVREITTLSMGPLRLAPVLLIQAHATPYVGDDAFFQAGDIAERGGFRLRHARLGLDARYETDAQLRVTGELVGEDDGTSRIHDAYVGWTTFEFAQLFAGAQVVPVSRFALLRSGRIALIDRPLAVRAMIPAHQVGATARGELWDAALSYQVGVFNGLERSNFFYEGYTRNYAPFGNRFGGLGYAARLASEPLGKLAGTAADELKGDPRFGVGASYFFSDGGARDIHTAGGDFHLQALGIHVIAEVLWARTVPDSEPDVTGALPFEITSFAAVAEAGYMILPRMLGITGRFEWIDPNTANEDESDNWLITTGAHFSFVDQLLKLQAEYTHREERFGLSLDNDAVTLSLQGQLDPARRGTATEPVAGGVSP